AAAALLSVGVHENEPLAHKSAVVVENRSVQVDIALQIAKELHVLALEHLVARAGLGFEREIVGKTGASSAFYTNAQSGGLNAFFVHHAPDFFESLFCDLDCHYSCFFFQSVIAALIASSARTEQ